MVALKESTSKAKRRWRRWWHRGWLRPDTAGLDNVNDRWRVLLTTKFGNPRIGCKGGIEMESR
ncbi:hypothetical protein OsI_39213 [Oryza sativa Indica Group]|uniref:Uncharacterized protein n=1 Tax=Oryza sativa subsp. indica TaxID=39946 RepID=B8BN50_ORYSI|nr:hypothetical protein OsI_39213 [Oryza sativa Indica Group]